MEDYKELQSKANQAKANLRFGQISLEDAKQMVKPYIDAVNEKDKKIAKEHGVRARLINVNSYLR